jgi:hypothetical protein
VILTDSALILWSRLCHRAEPLLKADCLLCFLAPPSGALPDQSDTTAQALSTSTLFGRARWASRGFLRSEAVLDHFAVTEEAWREPGSKDANFLASESPLVVGRAVASLAADPRIQERTAAPGLYYRRP